MLSPFKTNNRKLHTLGILFLFLLCSNAKAQTFSVLKDLDKIENEKLSNRSHQHHRPYIYKNEPASFKTLNPVSLAYGGLIYIYQNGISQHFSADCLYHPSCSDFSKQCVHEYGLVKGALLTFDRLNRCNRFTGADFRQSQLDHTNHFYDPISKYK